MTKKLNTQKYNKIVVMTKMRKINFLLQIIYFIFLIILFTFLHELGHFIMLNFLGIKSKIYLNLFEPKVIGRFHKRNPNKNYIRLVAVSGSLFELPFTIIFLILGRYKKQFGMYFSSWIKLLSNIWYWAISPIYKYGDAYIFLKMTPSLNYTIFTLLFILFGIITFILFIIDFDIYYQEYLRLNKLIRIEKTNYKEAQSRFDFNLWDEIVI